MSKMGQYTPHIHTHTETGATPKSHMSVNCKHNAYDAWVTHLKRFKDGNASLRVFAIAS